MILVKLVPKPSSMNKSEGWSFCYSFCDDIAKECRERDPDNAPSMESVDTMLAVLRDRGHIIMESRKRKSAKRKP